LIHALPFFMRAQSTLWSAEWPRTKKVGKMSFALGRLRLPSNGILYVLGPPRKESCCGYGNWLNQTFTIKYSKDIKQNDVFFLG